MDWMATGMRRRYAARPQPSWTNANSVREPAAVRQAAGEKLGRRRTGELAEVAVEVRLVVVAAVVGDLGPAVRILAPQPPDDAIEAQDPGQQLRRHADLLAELRAQVPPAPAELL